MPRVLTVQTSIHGRVVVEDAAGVSTSRLIVAFHGYAQSADEILTEVRRIPGVSDWRIACVQALHRFYTRSRGGLADQRVIASWMTREDRDLAIADNVGYVDRAVDALVEESPASSIVFLGFSQGVAMAYRAALLGKRAAAGIIALGGDIAPDVMAKTDLNWPPVLIGAGHVDQWYTEAKLNADIAFLRSRGVAHEVCRYPAGHEWTEEFRQAAGRWLAGRSVIPNS